MNTRFEIYIGVYLSKNCRKEKKMSVLSRYINVKKDKRIYEQDWKAYVSFTPPK